MKLLVAMCLLLIVGCANPKAAQTPSPTPDPFEVLVSAGQVSMNANDFESAALSFREALDLAEENGASHPNLEQLEADCTKAMMEAGGYYSSRRLWSEMKSKNPEAHKEAERMVKRAEKFMAMQAEELLNQAKLDEKDGHLLRAKATAKASLGLFQELPNADEQVKKVKDFLKSVPGVSD